ncbi:MAG: transcription termination factor Rho [Clostridium butyricum]|nr:transcription termination factor Rho [Clostridium butyricum]
MYKLQRLNVEKIAADESARDKYIAQGFKLVEDKKEDVNTKGDIDKLKVDELKELAKQKGIEGYSNMKKEELIAALEDK